MHTFFELQLKAGAIIGLMVLAYVFILARDSFFQRNRVWLLATLIVPWIMPMLAMPLWLKNWLFAEAQTTPSYLLPFDQALSAEVPQAVVQQGFDWQLALVVLFGVVSSILMLRLLWGYRIIFQLKKKAETRLYKGHKVVLMDDESVNPFSFFRTIFVPQALEKEADGPMILEHERTHCSQLHSIDISLAEWLLVLQWWNPFVWWLRKLIAQNHEYCVDNAMVKQTIETKSYQYALLNLLQGSKRLQLVNNFNKSLTKKRIVMMNKKHTNKIVGWSKGILMLPLMLALLLSFTNPEKGYKSTIGEEITSANDLRRFLAMNIKYPFSAQQAGAEGEVTVHFKVNQSGKVRQPVIGANANAIELSDVVVVAYKTDVAGTVDVSDVNVDYKADFERIVLGVMKKMPTISDKVLLDKTLQLKFKFSLQGESKPAQSEASKSGKEPIYIVDGEDVTKEGIDKINAEDIQQMNVLKGQAAIDKYGERAKDGAIEITTKKAENNAPTVEIKSSAKPTQTSPLLVVEGKPYGGELNTFSTQSIKSINVEKRPEMIQAYGEAGKDGVVIINTKDASVDYDDISLAAHSTTVKAENGTGTTLRIKGDAGNKQPLYIVNGEELDGSLKAIDSNDIKTVSVIKGKTATDLYGDKAQHGVVVIEMKDQK